MPCVELRILLRRPIPEYDRAFAHFRDGVKLMKSSLVFLFLVLAGNCVLPLSELSVSVRAEDEPILTLETGGHTAQCRWLDFTPDGQTLISLGNDKVVRIWNVSIPETPSLVRSIRLQIGTGVEGKLYAGAISPDGNWLAVGGLLAPEVGNQTDQAGDIRILKLSTGNVATVLHGHNFGAVTSLSFSSDGRWLASGSADKTGRVWDFGRFRKSGLSSDITSTILVGHADVVNAVEFEPGANGIVTGSYDGTARLWRLATNGAWTTTAVMRHTEKVFHVACSPDGHWIATSSLDRTVRLWNAEGEFIQVLGKKNGSFPLASAIDFSANSKWLVAADPADRGLAGLLKPQLGGTVVWSVPDGKVVSRFNMHDQVVPSAAFIPRMPDNDEPVIVASTGGTANQIFLWDARSGNTLGQISGRGSAVHSTAFSADGKQIAFGLHHQADSTSNRPLISGSFDLTDLVRESTKLSSDWIVGSRISDGLIASVEGPGPKVLVVRENGQVLCRIQMTEAHEEPRSVAFLKTKRQIAIGTDYRLLLVDVDEDKAIREFVGHTGGVTSVAISPDQETLISASNDQTVRLWDLTANGQVRTPRTVFAPILIQHIESSPLRRLLDTPDGGEKICDALTKTSLPQDAVRLLRHAFIPRQSPLLSLFFTTEGNDYVAWTEEGYYAASPDAENLIGWHLNQGRDQTAAFVSASQLRRIYYRPDIVSRVLTARSTQRAMELANAERDIRPQELVDIRTERDRLAVPEIKITSPEDRLRVTRAVVKLIGSVTPTGSLPLVEVRVTVNGRPIPGFQTKGIGVRPTGAGPGGRTLDVDVPLVPGENVVEVVALTAYATTQPMRRHLFREAPVEAYAKPSLYVVSAGVSRHENAEFNLDYADDDARDVLKALQDQQGSLYQKVEGRLLLDEDVTERNLRKELKWLRESVTQHDLAIVFVSGHGVPDRQGNYYYVPHDFDGDPTITGIPWNQFTEPLSGLPCKVILCMDTCHSAGVLGPKPGNAKAARGLERSVEQVLRQMTSIEVGLVVMTSSTGREESLEHSDWGHGAFALALIEGVSGKRVYAPPSAPPKTRLPADLNGDGVIELKELDVYVTQRVREITDGAQHPVTRSGDIPSFPLATAK